MKTNNRGYNICESCGKFMSPGSKGSSYTFVPDSEVTQEYQAMRCTKCTSEFGEIPPNRGCIQKYCSWTIN
jgi:hypothetical protein